MICDGCLSEGGSALERLSNCEISNVGGKETDEDCDIASMHREELIEISFT